MIAGLVLAICLVCQVAEMFDQWDHTLQTGNDTEYSFVVLALCVGVAYSLRWFVPGFSLQGYPVRVIVYRRFHALFLLLTSLASAVPIPASPPVAALRI